VSSSPDPRPWLEDGAPGELRSALESARLDEPSPERLAKVAAGLGPLLGAGVVLAPSAAAGQTVAAASVKSAVALKVLAAVGAVAVAGGAFQAGRVVQERATPPPPPPQIVEKVVRVEVPVPAPVPEPVVEPERAAPAQVKTPEPTPGGEVSLLESAMGALNAGDFARALVLCDRHRRDFKEHGVLVQEREVIAIEALVRLGKKAEAKKRAEKFKSEFPTSTHLLKVESLVAP